MGSWECEFSLDRPSAQLVDAGAVDFEVDRAPETVGDDRRPPVPSVVVLSLAKKDARDIAVPDARRIVRVRLLSRVHALTAGDEGALELDEERVTASGRLFERDAQRDVLIVGRGDVRRVEEDVGDRVDAVEDEVDRLVRGNLGHFKVAAVDPGALADPYALSDDADRHDAHWTAFSLTPMKGSGISFSLRSSR